jgi:threonine dehydrogenase-like Zn-dependent dehydrogenase
VRAVEKIGADIVVDPALRSLMRPGPNMCDDPEQKAARGRLPAAGAEACAIFECVGIPGLIQQVFEGSARARIVVVGVA